MNHFLSLKDLTQEDISELFDMTDQIKNRDFTGVLEGKTFALFFPNTSIRTRITFEKGIKELGGECILFPPESLNKKEKLSDVVGYLNQWIDGVIIRHPSFEVMNDLAEHAEIPIINAMSSENHPCEIVADLYTIRTMKPNFQELTYTFVGPPGNILNSWIEIAKVLGLTLQHVCSPGNRVCKDGQNYQFWAELEDKLVGSDVVLTDSLPPEYQTEDYIKKYQINLERMRLTNPGAILNPCPPFDRNQEVSENVMQSDYFVGHSFKKNLIYVQQAIIIRSLGLSIEN